MDKLKSFTKTFVVMFLISGGIAFVLAILVVAFGAFTVPWATGVGVGTGVGNGIVRGLFEAWDA